MMELRGLMLRFSDGCRAHKELKSWNRVQGHHIINYSYQSSLIFSSRDRNGREEEVERERET